MHSNLSVSQQALFTGRATSPAPSEQPPDDLMNTFVSAMRKGNEPYYNTEAEGLKLDLFSITEGIRLWPDLGIQPKPQHDFAFRSSDHAKTSYQVYFRSHPKR